MKVPLQIALFVIAWVVLMADAREVGTLEDSSGSAASLGAGSSAGRRGGSGNLHMETAGSFTLNIYSGFSGGSSNRAGNSENEMLGEQDKDTFRRPRNRINRRIRYNQISRYQRLRERNMKGNAKKKQAQARKRKMTRAAKGAKDEWREYRFSGKAESSKYAERKHGAAGLFDASNKKSWNQLFTSTFGYEPRQLFVDHVYFTKPLPSDVVVIPSKDKYPKHKFKSKDACVRFYRRARKKFGASKNILGYGNGLLKNLGCPARLNGKELWSVVAPLYGTFSKAAMAGSAHKQKKSVTASATYENRKSKDGKMRRFYTVTVSGVSSFWDACSMKFFMRMGQCSKCCCKGGLVKYEVQSVDTSRPGNKCAKWYISSMTATASFFSLWRMRASMNAAQRCQDAKCPA